MTASSATEGEGACAGDSGSPRPGILLDRDGTIIVDSGYVGSVDRVEFIAGAAEAIARFNQAGIPVAVVTNQAGIARGYYDVATFDRLTRWMELQFSQAGAPLAGVYYCPHHPDGTVVTLRKICDCRKPAPGLILTAQRELGIDLQHSFLIGDKLSDIEAGRAAGVGACFLVGPDGGAGFDDVVKRVRQHNTRAS